MSGTFDLPGLKPPCFQGTDVPLSAFMDWLREGQSIDAFIYQHPDVNIDEAYFMLDQVGRKMRKTSFQKVLGRGERDTISA